MQLTKQQLNHWKTFGFLVFRQYFSPEEWKTYEREFNEGMEAALERRRIEVIGPCVPQMDSNTPFIASLQDDPRFADVAEQLLGGQVLGLWNDAAWHTGDTGWHSDQVTSKYRALKFVIYPDPLVAGNGALRVIPGSHHESFSTQISKDTVGIDVDETYGIRQEEMPAYVFESNPGDVLVFTNALWHASFGGSERRRMGTILFSEYPQTPKSADDIGKIMYKMHKRYSINFGRQFYPDHWRSIDDKRHRHWVRRLKALDMLETPPPSSFGEEADPSPAPMASMGAR